MTVTTIFSGTADGEIEYQAPDPGGTYAQAREGTGGGVFTVSTAATTMRIGQQQGSAPPICRQSFVSFDTSGITDTDIVSAVTLDLWLTADDSTVDFTLNAKTKDWGASLTSADYVAGSTMSGLTTLATLASSGIGATGAYKTFTSNANFLTATNMKTGTVYVGLFSSRQEGNNAPSFGQLESLTFSSADQTGTTQDPKLTITHASPAVAPPIFQNKPMRVWRKR